MEVSYSEGLANHTGPESCVGVRKDAGEALTGVRAGWVLSREMHAPPRGGLLRGADAVEKGGRRDLLRRAGRDAAGPCAVRDPRHVRKHLAREPGDPTGLCDRKIGRAYREVEGLDADDERRWEVGPAQSTGEAVEQGRENGCGDGGGKGADQGKPARAQRTPDTGPARCAQRARAGTSSR